MFMDYLSEVERKMKETIENLERRLVGVRAGRANPSLVSNINVECYGSSSPLNNLANITVPEARQLFIKPFDRSILKDIERAIEAANLGINPTNNGEMIIITLPELTEEKRKDYVKEAKTIGEEAKVGLRNARQEGNTKVKAAELREDEEKRTLDEIQKLIEEYNKKVDELVKMKENELMEV